MVISFCDTLALSQWYHTGGELYLLSNTDRNCSAFWQQLWLPDVGLDGPCVQMIFAHEICHVSYFFYETENFNMTIYNFCF